MNRFSNAVKCILKIIGYPLLYLTMQIAAGTTYIFILVLVLKIINGIADIEFPADLVSRIAQIQAPLIISMFATLFVIYFINRKGWAEKRFWKAGEDSVVSVILCVILGAALNFLTIFVIAIVYLMGLLPEDAVAPPAESLILMIIGTGLIGPIVEEIIFRGIILKSLSEKINITAAIIIQAILFAVIHFDVLQSSYTFVLGLVIGSVFIRKDSLWPAIAIHIAYNMTSIIRTTFLQNISEEAFLILIGLSIPTVVLSLCMLYKKLSKADEKEIVKWQ